MASNTSRVGAAGAFDTAAQLAQRGWDASLTTGNTPRTDILAQHAETQRTIAVQCKTTTGDWDFMLSKGCEATSPSGRDEWFVLVNLLGFDVRPRFFVMPRNVVAAYVYIGHRVWLKGSAANGAPHKDSTMRKVERDIATPYLERWDLMEKPAEEVPYWLPDAVFEWEPQIGLPEGHPGLVRPEDDVERAGPPKWLPPSPLTPAV